MPGSILVGVDASTPSRSAIDWSVARAMSTDAQVDLLHVVDSEGWADGSAEAHAARERAESFVTAELAYAQSREPELHITAAVVEGRPAEVLAERSSGYTLLVVGTHKTGFIYGRTFGSSFLGLGWRSDCDVAFIPDHVGHERRGVVAGVGDSSTSDAVVLFAAAEAARSSQELVLVSSWGSSAHSPRGSAAARRSTLLARSVRVAKESQDHLRMRTRSVEHSTAESLIEASANAALLVIGRPRASAGSSTDRAANHNVLLNMSSPVIVVLDDLTGEVGTNDSASSATLLRA